MKFKNILFLILLIIMISALSVPALAQQKDSCSMVAFYVDEGIKLYKNSPKDAEKVFKEADESGEGDLDFEELRNLGPDESMTLPRFDKSQDDRASANTWPLLCGPIDLIILEGWCVGCTSQSEDDLLEPINLLEREEDATGEWRRYVNNQIRGSYTDLFAIFDALIFLQAPSFDAVYHWRLEQETKLAAVSADNAPGIMNNKQLARFIQLYERLTRTNLANLPATADVVLELNENHDCVRSSTFLPV